MGIPREIVVIVEPVAAHGELFFSYLQLVDWAEVHFLVHPCHVDRLKGLGVPSERINSLSSGLGIRWRLREIEERSGKVLTHVHFNTSEGRQFRRLSMRWYLTGGLKGILVTGNFHNADLLRTFRHGFFAQRILDGVLVLARYVREATRTSLSPKIPVEAFYPVYFPEPGARKEGYPAFDERLQIVIPGSVKAGRRDYNGLLEGLLALTEEQRSSLVEMVAIHLLGDSSSEEARAFLGRVEEAGLSGLLVCYEGWVSDGLFHYVMHRADFVMPLLTRNVPLYDKYIRYKIMGALSLAYGYRLPSLWIGECPIEEWARVSKVVAGLEDLAEFASGYDRSRKADLFAAADFLDRENQSRTLQSFWDGLRAKSLRGEGEMNVARIPRFLGRIPRFLGRRIPRFQLVRMSHLYQHWEIEHLKKFFSHFEVDCVFDVGANYGQYAQMLRKKVGYKGQIVSFEPIPDAVEILRELSKGDALWSVEHIALSDADGSQKFHIMESSQFSSLSTPRHDETGLFQDKNTVREEIDVTTWTLGTAFREMHKRYKPQRPFLKMDTQGYDVSIVRAGQDVMQEFVGLQSELAIRKLYAHSVDFVSALEIYRDSGFTLSAFVPNNGGHFPLLIELDCIMVRTDLIEDPVISES
jgi:FkbM family methyltransferase